MSRGDIALLVLWCVVVVVGGLMWELEPAAIVAAVFAGAAVFAVRLYLARRTWR